MGNRSFYKTGEARHVASAEYAYDDQEWGSMTSEKTHRAHNVASERPELVRELSAAGSAGVDNKVFPLNDFTFMEPFVDRLRSTDEPVRILAGHPTLERDAHRSS